MGKFYERMDYEKIESSKELQEVLGKVGETAPHALTYNKGWIEKAAVTFTINPPKVARKL